MKFVAESRLFELNLGPSIVEILRVSGAAGASIGILDGRTGEKHFAGFGSRNLSDPADPTADEHTVYHLASLSKSFTASAIGLLVSDGKLSFQDRMCDVLPGFHHVDDAISTKSTVLDFLSHRTGLAGENALWEQNGHELLLSENDTLPMVTYLEAFEPLGERWTCNNFGYDIMANVISHASGASWGDFVTKRIIEPRATRNDYCSLSRARQQGSRLHARAYWGIDRSNAVKSTISDLLVYYKAVLDAWRSETGSDAIPKEASHLKNITELLTPHIPLEPDSKNQWYGAGWAIAELPAPLGSIGTNGMFVPDMPLVCRRSKTEEESGEGEKKGPTLWYHNGSLVGFFSSVHILPEDGIIIVVLVNSIPKSDAADWIGQPIVQEQLGCANKNDYVALAKSSAKAYDNMWTQLSKDVVEARARSAPAKHTHRLSAYAGRYKAIASSWRWPDLDVATYLFHFGTDGGHGIATLRWVHDPDVPEGETFAKLPDTDGRTHREP
ncbi:beta-lactamase/transpeptidase-like protein [Podospora aff. communis PSN243]|uniref:Beta-lactamase/transpeptidase-like protein n=1 Tax=Podospora aff. communis PSN243 TaxID=3040156 RepID=A0AAV9G3Q5_9PEZI|nr:beta-lactamase/transpeptidase-like protein [Podospora aff. communis PSN243]